jgi:type IV secretory pathway VirB9-like protein
VFFSFRSVSCAKFYLCLLILHSGFILRFYPKVCYLDNLAKNTIAQIRYHDNDNYKNDLILNLGVKKIARQSKIILNLYKMTKNNETTTDMKYVQKQQRKQKLRNTEFMKIGRSLYFHNIYPITERHMYMVNKSSNFQSDFR